MHIKRHTIERSWPIPRKGSKYIVVTSHDKKNGLPLLIILRDILKLAKNKKEVKKILNSGLVLVNDKTIKKENFSVMPFSNIKIGEKDYGFVFSDKGKFIIQESEKKERVFKVTGKKLLKNKKVQLNLIYGNNIIFNEKLKINIGDSVVIDKGKIVKVLPAEKGKEVVVLSGKYRGRKGEIEKIEDETVILSCKDEKINVPIKSILVVK